ncbi:HIR complex subunit [Yamadazyma tenuis]|uniref:HIR complex subunit n=1 Tax=Candida tenuis TaxID=2315449 RepID=UPI00279C0A9F|nr:HIR complex subunit [Yamadazyma tenuis]
MVLSRDSTPSVEEIYPESKRVDLTDQVLKFRTSFQIEIPSKTSISSIMNYDKPLVEDPVEVLVSSPQKKKPAPKKIEPKKQEKRKLEKKPVTANKKKKTPEAPAKPVVKFKEPVSVPPPEIIEIDSSKKEKTENETDKELEESAIDKGNNVKEKEKEKPKEPERSTNNILEPPEKKEKKDLPIIALNIPLIDPKNPKFGQSEVVVNVLKLAEDKYGWSVVHPEAKSAIDTMDDLIDDDDDNDNDNDNDNENENEDDENEEEERKKDESKKEENKKEDSKKEENLSEEQLVRRHEAKMARKVGKYDFEDPFIDDDELQWEEKISSTKEGFFVYWGPLIEERNVKKPTKKR